MVLEGNFGQTLKLKSNTSHVYKSLLGRLSKQNTFYGKRTQSKTKQRSDEGWQEIRWCRWFSKKWFFTNKQYLNMHRHESNCKYDIAMFLMMICWQGFVVLTGKCFCATWKLIWDHWRNSNLSYKKLGFFTNFLSFFETSRYSHKFLLF